MLRSYIHWREERFAQAEDRHKPAVPLEWGHELIGLDPQAPDPLGAMAAYVRRHRLNSHSYFTAAPVKDYELRENELSFTSPTLTETLENNTVRCRVFESPERQQAALIIPHWNSGPKDYDRLAKWLARCGISALTMTLPYHGTRQCGHQRIASGMVSANLGLTIRSCRQAVLEARLALDWLQTRGYRRIALIGASLGTAIGSVVASHDSRINAVALLSLASDFGQVVWTSRATRHIRQAIEEDLTAEQLAEIWSLFSPIHYVHSLAAQNIPVLAVSGREDAVFQPHLTEELLRAYRTHGVHYERQVLPCGHYTMGSPPFSYLMLWSLQRFLKRELGASQDSNKVAKDLATPTASGSGPTRHAA